MSLGSFVETIPTSGKVGTKVIILGNYLKGTAKVAFNGTEAKFTVVSNTEIKTAVPTGATNGYVTVTTARKKLRSNVAFRVRKVTLCPLRNQRIDAAGFLSGLFFASR